MQSRFRTTQQSDPAISLQNLKFITVKSRHLKGRGDVVLYDHQTTDQSSPIVILLHGVYGSSWVWALRGAVHITLQSLVEEGKISPMILAMPSDGLWGDGTAYSEVNGINYERWITDDVPELVVENCSHASVDSPIFLAGLSMGGYGTLHLGSKYPHTFSGLSAHSAITHLDQMKLFVEEDIYQHLSREDDLTVTQRIIKNKAVLPPLRLDCGVDDLLIDYNRSLHRELDENSVAHTYLEFPGSHEWSYWQEHIVDSLLFFDSIAHAR